MERYGQIADEEKRLLESISNFPPNIPPKPVPPKTQLTEEEKVEAQKFIQQSQRLVNAITVEDNDKVPRELQQLQKLDEYDSVAKIIKQQADMSNNADQYTKTDAEQKLIEHRAQDQKSLEVKELGKMVGDRVTMDRAKATLEQITKQSIQSKNKDISLVASQILVGQVPQQELYDLNDMMGFDNQNHQEIVDYDQLHSSQVNTIQNLPIKELEMPPFIKEDKQQFQILARKQLIESYMATFPSTTMAQINRQDKFKKYVTEGTTLTYHSVQEIANNIQLSGHKSESQSGEGDFYNQVFGEAKDQFNQTLFTKNQVEFQTDYKVQPLSINEGLEMLNRPFAPVKLNKTYVDELAQAAKSFGSSYENHFRQLESELFERRNSAAKSLQDRIFYERQMQRTASQLMSEQDANIIKMRTEGLEVTEYVPETRTREPEYDPKFIIDFYKEYVNQQSEQDKRDKISNVLQNADLMRSRVFQRPDEILEYQNQPTLSECLVDQNISTECVPMGAPQENPNLVRFLDAFVGDEAETGISKRLKKSYGLLNTTLAEQIQVFDVLYERQKMVDHERVASLYEKLCEYVQNKWAYDALVKQINDELGIAPRVNPAKK